MPFDKPENSVKTEMPDWWVRLGRMKRADK